MAWTVGAVWRGQVGNGSSGGGGPACRLERTGLDCRTMWSGALRTERARLVGVVRSGLACRGGECRAGLARSDRNGRGSSVRTGGGRGGLDLVWFVGVD